MPRLDDDVLVEIDSMMFQKLDDCEEADGRP